MNADFVRDAAIGHFDAKVLDLLGPAVETTVSGKTGALQNHVTNKTDEPERERVFANVCDALADKKAANLPSPLEQRLGLLARNLAVDPPARTKVKKKMGVKRKKKRGVRTWRGESAGAAGRRRRPRAH